MVIMSKLNKLKFDLLQHLPYLLDLASKDFCIIPILKKNISRGKNMTNIEINNAVMFRLRQSFFMIQNGGSNVGPNGDYVEK